MWAVSTFSPLASVRFSLSADTRRPPKPKVAAKGRFSHTGARPSILAGPAGEGDQPSSGTHAEAMELHEPDCIRHERQGLSLHQANLPFEYFTRPTPDKKVPTCASRPVTDFYVLVLEQRELDKSLRCCCVPHSCSRPVATLELMEKSSLKFCVVSGAVQDARSYTLTCRYHKCSKYRHGYQCEADLSVISKTSTDSPAAQHLLFDAAERSHSLQLSCE